MSRVLFFLAIFIAIYLLLRSYRKRIRKDDAPDASVSGQAQDMVRCAHCGVHLPQHESILVGDQRYCSEAHRRAHADQPE